MFFEQIPSGKNILLDFSNPSVSSVKQEKRIYEKQIGEELSKREKSMKKSMGEMYK